MTKKELHDIADLCISRDLIVITDEIYSELVYEDDYKHVSIASLPEMKSRSILLHGFSKAYAMTDSDWDIRVHHPKSPKR